MVVSNYWTQSANYTALIRRTFGNGNTYKAIIADWSIIIRLQDVHKNMWDFPAQGGIPNEFVDCPLSDRLVDHARDVFELGLTIFQCRAADIVVLWLHVQHDHSFLIRKDEVEDVLVDQFFQEFFNNEVGPDELLPDAKVDAINVAKPVFISKVEGEDLNESIDIIEVVDFKLFKPFVAGSLSLRQHLLDNLLQRFNLIFIHSLSVKELDFLLR